MSASFLPLSLSEIKCNSLNLLFVHLEHDVDHDDKEGVGKVEEQPDLNGLDRRSGRTAFNNKMDPETNSGKDCEKRTYKEMVYLAEMER